ncbi:Uncharacterised protein [Bordetella pertussis]|nr:Uncharacterised protein [Bordetella pertussis]
MRGEHVAQYRFLAVEVMVQARFRALAGPGDIANGCFRVALARKHCRRALDDGVADILVIRRSRTGQNTSDDASAAMAVRRAAVRRTLAACSGRCLA